MVYPPLLHARLDNQHLLDSKFKTPHDAVQFFGAVQAQDYSPAKWALGLRLPTYTEEKIEQAFNAGEILRTHVMRPTWHFVSPKDIRWMQMLTAPRVRKLMDPYCRKEGLSEKVLEKTQKIITRALTGENALTRNELSAELKKEGLKMAPFQMGFVMSRAELDALVCSGPRKGKQFTYMLLEERAPKAKPMTHEKALDELIQRYFSSHAPATLHDFSWWSGLTLGEIRTGVEHAKLHTMEIEGETYWSTKKINEDDPVPLKARLLPVYDELFIGYRNSSRVYKEVMVKQGIKMPHLIFNNTLVIGDRVAGTWKGERKKDHVSLQLVPFEALNVHEKEALGEELERYSKYLGVPVKQVR